MSYKGKFVPKNISKYRGNVHNVVFRSLWERKMMHYLDNSPSILEWSSEEYQIPYISPIDKAYHRYFPDFWIKARGVDGTVFEALLEIKPEKQVAQPEPKKSVSTNWAAKKRFIYESATWAINQAKWEAAKKYCDERKWKFFVLTEKTIHGKLGKGSE